MNKINFVFKVLGFLFIATIVVSAVILVVGSMITDESIKNLTMNCLAIISGIVVFCLGAKILVLSKEE